MKTSVTRTLGLLSLGAALLLGSPKAQAQQPFPQQAQHHEDGDHKGRVILGGSLSAWAANEGKKLSFSFAPEVGYLFNDTFGVGLVAGFHYERNDSMKEQAWSLRPFGRYYYMHREPFNLYIDGGFGISHAEERMGWEVGLRPGACIDLTKGLCLCLRLGFAGYRKDFIGGEEPGLGTSGWGLRFAPEELQVGLELEL